MSEKAKETEEEFSFKCPTCKNGIIKINKAIYDSQDGDKLLILKFECNECNFTKNDIIPMSTKMIPGTITLKVKSERDLKSKIYRSPTGKLEIPELELLVEPGPRADFYFTNVEGILLRFEEAVKIYKNALIDKDPQFKEIEGVLDDLDKAIKGHFAFTLKITDPVGGSYIIPQKNTEYEFEEIKNPKMNNEFKVKEP